jgi:hypothetical protein
MTDDVSGDDVTFPPDYWKNQQYYALNAEEREKVDRRNQLSCGVNSFFQEPAQPLTADAVQTIWDKIQVFRECEFDESANEWEIQLAQTVLKAIAENQCVDISECAEIVREFKAYGA